MNTLATILDKLQTIDSDLAPEEFDPAAVVGDLRDKVDAIKWRLDQWEQESEALEGWIRMLQARKVAIDGKNKKLKEYVAYEMSQKGFETLPGHMVRIDLQERTAVSTHTQADATAYLSHPEFVRQKTVYEWDKVALQEALKSGIQLSFAYIESRKFVRFYTKKGVKNVEQLTEGAAPKSRSRSIRRVTGKVKSADSSGTAQTHESRPDASDSSDGISEKRSAETV